MRGLSLCHRERLFGALLMIPRLNKVSFPIDANLDFSHKVFYVKPSTNGRG